MTEKQKCVKRVELLREANALLLQALRLGGHHFRFGQSVVDAQLHLDDAIVWADRKQTLLTKSA